MGPETIPQHPGGSMADPLATSESHAGAPELSPQTFPVLPAESSLQAYPVVHTTAMESAPQTLPAWGGAQMRGMHADDGVSQAYLGNGMHSGAETQLTHGVHGDSLAQGGGGTYYDGGSHTQEDVMH